MKILTLKVRNFGRGNINGDIRFAEKNVNLNSEPYIYEALRCLFDPNFTNDLVTKRNESAQNKSFVQVTLRDFIRMYSVKRLLNETLTVVFQKKTMTLNKWYKKLHLFQVLPIEPQFTTTQSFIHHQLNEMRHIEKLVLNKMDAIRTKMQKLHQNLPESCEHVVSIMQNDLETQHRLNSLKHVGFSEHQERCAELYKEFLANVPKKRSGMVDVIWMHQMNKLQSNIFKIEKDNCIQVIQSLTEINREDEEIVNIVQAPRRVGPMDQLSIEIDRSQKLRNNAEKLSRFYENDLSFVSACKNMCVCSSANKSSEEAFYAKLQEICRNEREEQQQMAQDVLLTKKIIQQLVEKLNQYRRKEIYCIVSWFECIQSKYKHQYEMLNEYVCGLLNHLSLECTNMQPCVIGLLHAIMLDLPHRTHFFFEEVLDEHPQSKFSQSLFAPFSNVLYYNSTEEVVDVQKALMNASPVSDYETIFVLAELDTDNVPVTNECQSKPVKYTREMINLFSNSFISKTVEAVGRNNLPQIFESENVEMFKFESTNLLKTLRLLTNFYSKIACRLSECNHVIEDIKMLTETIIECSNIIHQTESKLESERIKLHCLRDNYEYKTLVINKLETLMWRSRCRLTNWNKLLSQNFEDTPGHFWDIGSQDITESLNLLSYVSLEETAGVTPRRGSAADSNKPLLYPNDTILEKGANAIAGLNNILKTWELQSPLDIQDHSDFLQWSCKFLSYDLKRVDYWCKQGKRLKQVKRQMLNNPEHQLLRNDILNLDDIKQRIDAAIYSLLYPKVKSLRLCEKSIRNQAITAANIEHLTMRSSNVPPFKWESQLETICEEMSFFVQNIRLSVSLDVHCELRITDLNLTDWSRHVLEDVSTLQAIFFRIIKHGISIERTTLDKQLLAIGCYIFRSVYFTRETIFLNEKLKGMTSAEKKRILTFVENFMAAQ